MAGFQERTTLGKTIAGVPRATLGPTKVQLRSVPVLSPVVGEIVSSVRIVSDEFFIGRQAGSHLRLHDGTVSRVHARIIRREADYILEDLGSSHGTFVDNVPIVSSTLGDGDTIQIGRSVFYFHRRGYPLPSTSHNM